MPNKATTDFSDYILGGRSLGSVVTALSAGASDMSGWLLMGLPGAIYLSGLSEAWIAIGLIIGAWLNWLLGCWSLTCAHRSSEQCLNPAAIISPAVLVTAKVVLRMISALLILVFFAFYCASGMVAGARIIRKYFWHGLTPLPYGSVQLPPSATYVLVAFLAISWTDTFQAGLMIFALLLDTNHDLLGHWR